MTQLFISEIGWINIKEDYEKVVKRFDAPVDYMEVTELVKLYDQHETSYETLERKIMLPKRHIIKVCSTKF